MQGNQKIRWNKEGRKERDRACNFKDSLYYHILLILKVSFSVFQVKNLNETTVGKFPWKAWTIYTASVFMLVNSLSFAMSLFPGWFLPHDCYM